MYSSVGKGAGYQTWQSELDPQNENWPNRLSFALQGDNMELCICMHANTCQST